MATAQEIRQRVEEHHRKLQDLMVFIIAEFQCREGVDLSQDPMALQRVDEQARACWPVHFGVEQLIEIPYVTATPSGPKHIKMLLRRKKRRQQDGHYV